MESRGRIENVQELKSNILGFLEQDPEDATLSGFLNEIALYTDLDSVEAGDDCVTMMTIHSAKGLEFPDGLCGGDGGGHFPRRLRPVRPGGAGGGATAVLCGYDPRQGEAPGLPTPGSGCCTAAPAPTAPPVSWRRFRRTTCAGRVSPSRALAEWRRPLAATAGRAALPADTARLPLHG